KLPRNFERLINHDRVRRRRIPQKLRHRSPQHIPVDGRHPVHAPVLGVFANQPINLRHPVAGDSKQIVCKPAHFIFHVAPLRPKRLPDKLRRLLSHIRLKQHLQNQFAGFASSAHGGRWSLVVGRSGFVFSVQGRARPQVCGMRVNVSACCLCFCFCLCQRPATDDQRQPSADSPSPPPPKPPPIPCSPSSTRRDQWPAPKSRK